MSLLANTMCQHSDAPVHPLCFTLLIALTVLIALALQILHMISVDSDQTFRWADCSESALVAHALSLFCQDGAHMD